jgi:RimJ/RimL family protein N-acetyltransferase
MIRLEPLAPVHAPALQLLLEDPAVAATTPFPHPYPPDGAERYVAESISLRVAGTKYVFAVCEPDGAPIGMSLIKDVDATTGEGELGYWIGRPYWGLGHATRAAAATLGFAFGTLDLRRAHAVCLEANAASLRVLDKLGFVEARRFLQALPKWPDPRPSIGSVLSREEWSAQHTRSADMARPHP